MLNRLNIDQILRALAEPTRRLIVERLGRSPASVSDIAQPFDMSLAAIVQHLQVLEEAGIVASEKVGRVRTYRLEPGGMDGLALWIEERRHPAERRLDRLAAYLAEADEQTEPDEKGDEQPMTDTANPAAIVHSTFRLERHYKATPSRVFFALSDTAAKRRWLVEGEGFEVFEHTNDFRILGMERSRFRYGDGPEIVNETIYQDIVPDARIVFSYRMAIGDAPMSVSLTTMELVPSNGGTLLIHTEQGTYLDGSDDGTGREEGTRGLLEILAREVEG